MSNEIWVVAGIISVVSILIGFLVGKSFAGGSAKNQAQDAHKELESYKAAVSEHFGKTADLVDNLTASYKEVFEHLGSSAKELLSEEEVNRHLTSRAEKAVTLTYVANPVIIEEQAAEQATVDSVNNPMEQAQAEIQVDKVLDTAKVDAEKMAASLAADTPEAKGDKDTDEAIAVDDDKATKTDKA